MVLTLNNTDMARHINQLTLKELNDKIRQVEELSLEEHRTNGVTVRWNALYDLKSKLQYEASKRAKEIGVSHTAMEELGIIM